MAETTCTRGVTYTNCGNIHNSFNTINYESNEDAQIMLWLSPLEPGRRHDSVRTTRFEGAGAWFLGKSEFREWRESEAGADKNILFCSGDPGVGKTYLSSLVIDELCDQAREEDLAVAWLYCDYNAQQEQTVINMMGAILRRLVGREIPEDIREAFEEGRRPLLSDLMRILRITIASLPQVCICIDALDECLPKDLPEILESLRDIVRESPSTRIFLTGRPHVGGAVRRYFAEVVVIPVSPNHDDIRNYLEKRLDRDDVPKAMNNDLRASILKTILEKMSDIFLLVSLTIETILGEITICQRRKKLEEMTRGNGLSDAYTATLTRLKAQKGNRAGLGLQALMWVLYSERPLRVEELCHALGVEIGSAGLDPENIPESQTVLSSCLGLITIEVSSSTIRLVHFTLQEYLLRDPALFHSPHSTIAEVCLTYLNFGPVRNLSPTLDSAPSTMPLLEYASLYWGKHTRMEMTENVKILALRLLDRFDEHISAQLLLLSYERHNFLRPRFDKAKGPAGFTGLHGVAYLGTVEVVAAVLQMKKWDVNGVDCMGSTALTWAALRGKQEVVRVFLKRGDVNPNKADTKHGRTPLSWAAGNGHEGIVKVLLERKDVNPNQADTQYGRAPLSWAAGSGHEEVVKTFLEREGINPDNADSGGGRTPLSLAAGRGREGVVKILLEREDVNPDQADTEYGRVPLSWAAGKGHQGVVKMLLQREDVDPDHADTIHGRTPLSRAAEKGHEGVVKLLLEQKDVNPDRADTLCGQTPLAWAAEKGHEGVVKLLLEREDVNPHRTDTKYGRTPLLWATKNGRKEIVKILSEWDNVRPSSIPGIRNQSLPPLAPSEGHDEVGVAKTLAERNDVDSDKASHGSQAALKPPAQPADELVAEMQPRSRDPNTDVIGLDGQRDLPPTTHDELRKLPDPQDSIFISADHGPSTQSRWWSQPLSIWPLKLCCRRKQTKTHPSNT